MVEIKERPQTQDTQEWQESTCRSVSMPRIGPSVALRSIQKVLTKAIYGMWSTDPTPCLDPQERRGSSDNMSDPGMINIIQITIEQRRTVGWL